MRTTLQSSQNRGCLPFDDIHTPVRVLNLDDLVLVLLVHDDGFAVHPHLRQAMRLGGRALKVDGGAIAGPVFAFHLVVAVIVPRVLVVIVLGGRIGRGQSAT